MRIYLNKNVYDEGKKRITWLFDEFENIVVSYSGGKDSIALLELTIEVAREKGRLPVDVMFLDQEAEWSYTIEMVKSLQERAEEVKLFWYQIPFLLNNSTSGTDESENLDCWNPDKKDEWIHEQDPDSIKENTYGTEYFNDILKAITVKDWGDNTANLSGVRTEESPGRLMGLTGAEVYGGETWGNQVNKKRRIFTFYPLYDWSYTDIWKAIHDHKWRYNKLYDFRYAYGITITNMRVSSLIHETALAALQYLQEVDREVYDRITQRLGGIRSEEVLGKELSMPSTYPARFKGWKEYRDYLIEHLIEDEVQREKYRKYFHRSDYNYGDPRAYKGNGESGVKNYWKQSIKTIIRNDHFFTMMKNFYNAQYKTDWLKERKKEYSEGLLEDTKENGTTSAEEAVNGQ